MESRDDTIVLLNSTIIGLSEIKQMDESSKTIAVEFNFHVRKAIEKYKLLWWVNILKHNSY